MAADRTTSPTPGGAAVAIVTGLVAVATALHLAAMAYLDRLPPELGLDLLLVVLPVLTAVAAVVLLLVRRDPRGVVVACVLEWLLVLFTLPAFGRGLALVPSAVVLSVALRRVGSLSSDRAAAG